MVNQPRTWSSEQRIASDTASGSALIAQLLEQMRNVGWEDHDLFAVHLALEEALVNAIKHGNQKDPEKFVTVMFDVDPERVRIEITDEGSGFDPADVPDPTDEDNLELPSGRGLMLMRTYMSSVTFNEYGNQVVMEKERTVCPEQVD